VAERYEAYRRDFIIPPERIDTVFRVAIEEARTRTAGRIELPADENFVLELVTDRPWSGYNWYQGGAQSLIQMNVELPIHIDRAIDLAAHEGYPGHHVYSTLLEQELVRGRGWLEYSVYPLFSPQSLIAEGAANYGIDVAFPGDERLTFERDVLFPLAGLDPDRAGEYARVRTLADRLSYAGNEAARAYLERRDQRRIPQRMAHDIRTDGAGTGAAARPLHRDVSQLRHQLQPRPRPRRCSTSSRRGGTADRPDRRWELFSELLSTPRLPSDLR
jgi:hypothetical protein